MRKTFKTPVVLICLSLLLTGCKSQIGTSQAAPLTTASPASAPVSPAPITSAALSGLFADEAFKAELKSKLQLTDEQISGLRKIAGSAASSFRKLSADEQAANSEAAKQKLVETISVAIGAEKSALLMALAGERWSKRSQKPATAAALDKPEPTMLPGPNAVPTDTRIVVNIPAFRMDVFKDGSLIKSYKVGIGYPQFPLDQGLRKAEMIIFNPTWTPPHSPWVNTMKVTPGQMIAAGSKQNPLGPIKIPIGAPSLIHGGKAPEKIGNFASHGCVGMTNDQVKDFARTLAEASHTDLTEDAMAAYLKQRTKTRVINLAQLVPVELRYETIVFEDGKLHIYRDVYNQNTNTEANLRAVFAAHGSGFDNLAETEKESILEALNALSRNPKKLAAPKPFASPSESPQTSAQKAALAIERKTEAERQKKLRSQREIVIEVAELAGKGYPTPVNLDSGSRTQVSAVSKAPPNTP
jgi:lipoprotein-anchoring transpeptidase ErfK/SrfK